MTEETSPFFLVRMLRGTASWNAALLWSTNLCAHMTWWIMKNEIWRVQSISWGNWHFEEGVNSFFFIAVLFKRKHTWSWSCHCDHNNLLMKGKLFMRLVIVRFSMIMTLIGDIYEYYVPRWSRNRGCARRFQKFSLLTKIAKNRDRSRDKLIWSY